MKVYVVYRKDLFGGYEIGHIFSSLDSARKFIIEYKFSGNKAYANKSEEELITLANKWIEEFKVEK